MNEAKTGLTCFAKGKLEGFCWWVEVGGCGVLHILRYVTYRAFEMMVRDG